MVKQLLKPEDIIIFRDDVVELRISQEDVLKQLGNTGQRVILICAKDSSLVMTASAFGVRDFIFPPFSALNVLHLLQNPATSEEAAKKLAGVKPAEEPEEEQPRQKTALFKNLGTKLREKLSPEKKQRNGQDEPVEEVEEKPKAKNWFKRPSGKKKPQIEQEENTGRQEEPVEQPKVKRIPQPFGLRDGKLEKVTCSPSKPEELLKYSVIFLPDTWPSAAVKKLRRKVQAKSLYIVIVGDSKDFLAAGVDRCVPEITEEVIEEVTFATERLKKLWLKAETDILTGCYTRSFWDVWLLEQKNLQVFICDLDHFKNVNDTHGHPYGDRVLKEFANFLQTNIRPSDILCRWGGEEFVVGMPQTSAQDAYYIGSRLCTKWERASTKLFEDKKLTVTLSGGLGKTVKEADQNLYKAKESGRNKVVSALEPVRRTAQKTILVKIYIGVGYQPEEIKAFLSFFSLKRGEPALICDTTGEFFPDFPEYPLEPKSWGFDLHGGNFQAVQAEAWQVAQLKPDIVLVSPDASNVAATHSFCLGEFLHFPQKAVILSNYPHATRKTLPLTRQAIKAYLSGNKRYLVPPATSFLSRVNKRLRIIPRYLSYVLGGVKSTLIFLFQSLETIFWIAVILLLVTIITWIVVAALNLFDVYVPLWLTDFFARLDYLLDSVVYR